MGKTNMNSSHILSELKELCNKVGIIERGRLLYTGPIEEVVKKTDYIVLIQVREAADAAAEVLRSHELVAAVEEIDSGKDATLEIKLAAEAEDHTFLIQLLVDKGYRVASVREKDVDLEEAFMKVTKGQVA